MSSPFFRYLDSAGLRLDWVHPEAALAHPFDDGSAALITGSIEETAGMLGADAAAYTSLIKPLAADWQPLSGDILSTLRLPMHPFTDLRFAVRAVDSAAGLAGKLFKTEKAKGLLAGLCAHSVLPLEQPGSAAFGIIMAVTAHTVGWPVAAGGSGSIAAALTGYLKKLGGEIITGRPVNSIDELPGSAAVFFDTAPRQVAVLAGDRLPETYTKKLIEYRYGPGVFKLDWALDGPIPWMNGDCRKAAALHLGGSFEEIALAEREAWRGRNPEKPFVILSQPSLFDSSRAPDGKHTAWAYCHVPNSSGFDMTERIEAQIERFAPGFGKLVLARSAMSPAALEKDNPNLVGGDITGGAQNLKQLFFRPLLRMEPYSTPDKRLFICSASTPPGAGVHCMCGFHAAQAFLRRRR
jgi:phytoene dehydrogenase-like protein